MARVTVEDCLARIPNRFALTILASRRARALGEGRGHALIDCENKEGVTALREVSDARVRFRENVEESLVGFIEEQRRQLRVTTGEHTFLEAASLRALEEDDDDVVEDDDSDVEELQSDPEALGKQAKGEASDSDDGDDGDDDTAEASSDDESNDEEDEIETPFSEDDDIPETDDDGDADDSESADDEADKS